MARSAPRRKHDQALPIDGTNDVGAALFGAGQPAAQERRSGADEHGNGDEEPGRSSRTEKYAMEKQRDTIRTNTIVTELMTRCHRHRMKH